MTSIASKYQTTDVNLSSIKQLALEKKSDTARSFIFCRFFRSPPDQEPNHTCKNIFWTVLNPERLTIIVDHEVQDSTWAKIHALVQNLKRVFPKNAAPLSYFFFNNSPENMIQQLVTAVFDQNTRARARYALLLLENIDPSLEALNNEISRDPSSNNRHLQYFIKNPPHSFKIHLPLRPLAVKPHRLNASSNPSWEIKKILIGSEKNHDCYVENLEELGETFGFTITKMTMKWMRDAFIRLNDQEILLPARMSLHRKDILPTAKYFGYRAPIVDLIIALTADPNPAVIGEVASERLTEKLYYLKGAKEVSFYFEGGNVFFALTQKGKKYCLCGPSNVLFSLVNSAYTFASSEAKKALLEKMQDLEKSKLFSTENLSFVQERLEKAKLLENFPFPQDRIFITKLTIASCVQIEKQMEKTLGCSVLVLGSIFKPQVEYHLDYFLLPAPDGTIFIQDNSLCTQVLREISKQYTLSTAEKEQLALYLDKAENPKEHTETSSREISEMLSAAGFNVVPFPGVYYGKKHHILVNFLNAIVGQNKGIVYCLTNGSSHSLDRYLRKAAVELLHKHGIDEVYFTGKETSKEIWEPLSPNSYPEAEKSLACGGGIHCRTFENFMPEPDKTKEPPMEALPMKYAGDALLDFYREMLQASIASQSFGLRI
ncbi:MAG: hypothetical protein K1000chlam3_01399 [Chlamydiae bacterium]|nr:hypothetical protein [Chlamydiota bacterium]